MNRGDNIAEVENLHKTFDRKRSDRTYAVYDLTLAVRRGEILGLVGESGCGKSTLGKLMLRLDTPTRGRIFFDGRDISRLGYSSLRPIRHRMQMVFQEASTAFNPYYTVRRSVGEPLGNFRRGMPERELLELVVTQLERVGLGAEHLGRYPGELSGGQLQRVGLARALIVEPDFLVCDESVSSIDHAVKNAILDLLAGLRREKGSSYLFISHDLAAVRRICDRVAVMYLGNLVELMPRAGIRPGHPYTAALTAATLSPDPRRRGRRKVLFKEGEELRLNSSGCVFQNRCLLAAGRCAAERPLLDDRGGGHLVACHLPDISALEAPDPADGGPEPDC
ncbi:MAG: ABC transporter ATP-binding protein [Deltaproteobacteria bacterium]|jgi:peptide/nickel transport system ATP-binding protein/oligopeptide transport system ATP-binding protein|nr:ABC transporter ATP-binding protein [Deltaproteobacteria bacterium]